MYLDTEYLKRSFLPFVQRPDRYVGGELNLPRLPDQPVLRVALAFPDLYELGMSYLGLRILLHLGNRVEGVACERVFMPWFDAVNRLKTTGIPLFTLESRTPLNKLDLLGVNLQYELHATNTLAMLDLGGVPLRSEKRAEEDPLILGGGPLAYSPEPFAPFFDAIVVGDGECVFPEILEVLKAEKKKGSSRRRKIRALGEIPGVYLPGYYQPRYTGSGKYRGLRLLDSSLPSVITARITPALLPEHYPPVPIVPNLEVTHNRLVLEIARGCSRGCRFCAPGLVNRPVRERPVADLLNEARSGLAATGYSEVSLLSLSTADYRYLDQLLDGLEPLLAENRASLSFPSLRPDLFTTRMADRASAQSRTGLTFAPEAATPRLRAVINKQTSDEALLSAARLAYAKGWNLLKLYFMIGLPTETEEDVQAIIDLVRGVEQIGRYHQGRKLNVSVSPFSPKPHTPFQREGQMGVEELHRRLGMLRRGLGKSWMVKLDARDPEIARVELAISRSDRRGADAIEASYRAGGLFDAWSDGFYAKRWDEAFQQAGLDPAELTAPIAADEVLPWDHIDVGIDTQFLQSEKDNAAKGEFTPDCRVEGCQFCGLHERIDLPCPEVPVLPVDVTPVSAATISEPCAYHRYRLIYRRREESRFSAHLSVISVLERALRRLRVPLEFTKGFKPHLRLAASPPLGVGMTSRAEYLDFGIGAVWSSQLMDRLQEVLPQGIQATEVLEIPENQPSIGALNVFLYRAKKRDGGSLDNYRDAIINLLSSRTIPILRTQPKKARAFDGRPGLWKLELEGENLLIGLKAVAGPIPRVEEIIRLIAEASGENAIDSPEEIMATWDIERVDMWWHVEGVSYHPTKEPVPVENNHNKTT